MTSGSNDSSADHGSAEIRAFLIADVRGYTLFTHHSGLPAAAALYANLRYDSRTAFEPLGLVNTGPMVLLSRKTLETANVKELFDWLKGKGDKATVGFAGVGSNSYICATLLPPSLFPRWLFRSSAVAVKRARV